jgi:hypothetical protein
MQTRTYEMELSPMVENQNQMSSDGEKQTLLSFLLLFQALSYKKINEKVFLKHIYIKSKGKLP